jgi:hypothetical protein
LQDWSALPVHCPAPGVHTPVQAPATQAELLHPTGELQVPFDEHVCTPLPEHRAAPGSHTPTHAPRTHAVFTHAATALHWPLAEHVCTP